MVVGVLKNQQETRVNSPSLLGIVESDERMVRQAKAISIKQCALERNLLGELREVGERVKIAVRANRRIEAVRGN